MDAADHPFDQVRASLSVADKCSDKSASGGVLRLQELRDICSICHDPLFNHDTWEPMKGGVFVLGQCAHLFHVNCIRTWASKNHVCPVCRGSVTRNDMCNMLPRDIMKDLKSDKLTYTLRFTDPTAVICGQMPVNMPRIHSYLVEKMIERHFHMFFSDKGPGFISDVRDVPVTEYRQYFDVGEFWQLRTHASDMDDVYKITYHMLRFKEKRFGDNCVSLSTLMNHISKAWQGMVIWGHIFCEAEMTPVLTRLGQDCGMYALYPATAFGSNSKLTLVDKIHDHYQYPFLECAKAVIEVSKELLVLMLQQILPIRSHYCIRGLMIDIDAYSDAVLNLSDHQCYDYDDLLDLGSVDPVHGESRYTNMSEQAVNASDHNSHVEEFQYIYFILRTAHQKAFNTAMRLKHPDSASWKRSVKEFYLIGLETYYIKVDYNCPKQPFTQFLTHALNYIHLSIHACLDSDPDSEKFMHKAWVVYKEYETLLDMDAIEHYTQSWCEFDFWNGHVGFWIERVLDLRTLAFSGRGHYARRAAVARYILRVERLNDKLWNTNKYTDDDWTPMQGAVSFVKVQELGFISRLRNVFLSGKNPCMDINRR